jgi:hypothetical protein
MTHRLRRAVFVAGLFGTVAVAAPAISAGDEKGLVGSYRLTKRVGKDGQELTGPTVIGIMTFSRTHRTVIMKWNGADGEPVSISFIATYTLSGGKYCESIVYGEQSNLGAPGVSYDTPSTSPTCTAARSDASGLAFDIPNEKLRLRVTRAGILATTPRWTDHWDKVK